MDIILRNISLNSITSWLPETKINLRDFGTKYGEKAVESIINATGIEEVRIADSDMCASDMCFNAAQKLIEMEGLDLSTIDGLVFVSQTCDWILPATSISIQNRLGLPKSALCLDIHYGCSGYIYGLLQAALWITSGCCKNVLVLTGDTTSRMINPEDKSLMMVFGDCGTASLVTRGIDSWGFSIMSDGSGSDKLIVEAGGFRTPRNDETSIIHWDADNNGHSKNDLYMDGMAIFNFAIRNVHKNINGLIETMHWNKDDVGFFGLHQANKFMVEYIGKKLNVSKEFLPINCQKYGNTGPSTIPLLLCDKCSSNEYGLNKSILSGFGVGLSWGSVALNLSKTKFHKPFNE